MFLHFPQCLPFLYSRLPRYPNSRPPFLLYLTLSFLFSSSPASMFLSSFSLRSCILPPASFLSYLPFSFFTIICLPPSLLYLLFSSISFCLSPSSLLYYPFSFFLISKHILFLLFSLPFLIPSFLTLKAASRLLDGSLSAAFRVIYDTLSDTLGKIILT